MKAPAKTGGALRADLPGNVLPWCTVATSQAPEISGHCIRGAALAEKGPPQGDLRRVSSSSPNEGAAEALVVGWWRPVTSAQAAAVGGEGIQSRWGLEALSHVERKRWTALTSSVYWMSSTAYFSLKCSLEWILKGKHRNARVRVWLPSCPEAQAVRPLAHPCPADTWHYAGLPNTDSPGLPQGDH